MRLGLWLQGMDSRLRGNDSGEVVVGWVEHSETQPTKYIEHYAYFYNK
jgi:hypothetical protein